MTDRSKTVVMLIDWDNLQICHSRDAPGTELDLFALIALAQSYGTLVSARAYAEWNLASERLAVYKAGIEPVFAPVMRPEGSLREGKSLADTVMVAEGVDLLWTVAPDVFVLVTSDKDMIPLARIAKQRGAAVVVLGSDLTAIPLVEMSNVFITYRQLLRELDRVTELDAPSGRAPARERRGLRETRRPGGGEPYGASQERRGQGVQGGMRAVAAPVPSLSALSSAPTLSAPPAAVTPPIAPSSLAPSPLAPSPAAPITTRTRRDDPERPAALAPVGPPVDADAEQSDSGSLASGEGGARRRRRRGGRGRGRPGELVAGDDRLQEIEAALMAGLPLDAPLPIESFEAEEDAELAADMPSSASEGATAERARSEGLAAEPRATEASEPAAAEVVRSRRRAPQPTRSTFGQVRRGVAFSEFGAPPSVPTTTDAGTAAEPNDAVVGPSVAPAAPGSVDANPSFDPGAARTDAAPGETASIDAAPVETVPVDTAPVESSDVVEAAAESEPTAGEASPEPVTGLSLVPAGAVPDDEGLNTIDTSMGGANGQATADEAAPSTDAAPSRTDEAAPSTDARSEHAPGESTAPVASDAASADADGASGSPDATAVEPEPAPKPVRRRRTRRPPTASADAASG